MVDPGDKMDEHIKLGRHFGAANNGRHRVFGATQCLAQRFQFGLHRPTGKGWQDMCQSFGRGMGAVRHRKGIVDVKITETGECGDERRVIGFLAGMKAGVLEHHDVARGHRRHRSFGFGADAFADERHRPPHHLAQRRGDGRKAQ